MDKMPVPWRGVQLLLQLGGVPLELFAALISNYLFSTSSTDLLANSEMFTASTNTRNFKFVVILEMVYVHLDGFVYKMLIMLGMLRMARNIEVQQLEIFSGIPKLGHMQLETVPHHSA